MVKVRKKSIIEFILFFIVINSCIWLKLNYFKKYYVLCDVFYL